MSPRVLHMVGPRQGNQGAAAVHSAAAFCNRERLHAELLHFYTRTVHYATKTPTAAPTRLAPDSDLP